MADFQRHVGGMLHRDDERTGSTMTVPVVHPEPGDRPMWIEAAAQAIYDHEYDEDQERCACGFDTDGDQARHQAEIAVAAAVAAVRADRDRLAGQVAAIRALGDEIEAATSECGAWWMAREMGLERPERQHYPDEGWSFCDGCSAAQAGDYDSKAIAARIRAALVASSPTTPEAKK